MADIIDNAQKAEDAFLRSALSKRPTGPKATGFCLCCGTEQDDKNRRWCDAQCRDEWQRENPEPVTPRGGEYIEESARPPEELEAAPDEESENDGC